MHYYVTPQKVSGDEYTHLMAVAWGKFTASGTHYLFWGDHYGRVTEEVY